MTERKLAPFGIAAFCGFVLSFLIFARITPGYSHTVNTISELGIEGSPYALPWNVIGFGLVGLLVLPFSWSLWVSLRPAPSAKLISLLIAVSGIGWSSLGLFPASPGFQPSLHTTLHFAAVMVNYLSFLIAAFLFAIMLRREPYWNHWVFFSLLMGLLGLLTFFIPGTIMPPALSQRLALVVYFLWVLVMSWAVIRKPLPAVQ